MDRDKPSAHTVIGKCCGLDQGLSGANQGDNRCNNLLSPSTSDIRPSRDRCQGNDGTLESSSYQHKKQLFRMIGVTVIPIFTLIGLNIAFLHDAAKSSQAMQRVQSQIEHSIMDLGTLIHRLQIERGISALYISSNNSDFLQDLQSHYIATNSAAFNISVWFHRTSKHTHNHEKEDPSYLANRRTFLKYIQDFRDQLHQDATTLHEELRFYTDIIDYINRWTLYNFRVLSNQNIWPKLVSYEQLILAKDHAGIERALGSAFFAMGGFTNYSMYRWFLKESSYEDALLEISSLYSSISENEITNLTRLVRDQSLNIMKDEIIQNNVESQLPSWAKGNDWFKKMTDYIDELLAIQARLADNIMIDLAYAIDLLQTELIISITIMAVILLISPLIVQLIALQTKKIQEISETLEIKMDELAVERERSENLLGQMLPPSVAQELKMGNTVHAEYFEQVTIFFSDLVNFTSVCSQSTPLQVVDMLNTLYHVLDGTIEQFDAYKIETIGDAYMVASECFVAWNIIAANVMHAEFYIS
ncbi:uncharacterized protein [Amphiura filiformis]|uniref:uncharacterized protein n=1 Tax=Amphiura filiformis TaxID=82378 RepID=UPI003B226F11